MSLINEALKKAQRVRTDGAAADLAGSGSIAKRAEPKSAKSTLLLAAGAVVLVVISMVATALWISRPVSHPATVPAPAITAMSTKMPTVVVPALATPVPATEPPIITPVAPPVTRANPPPATPVSTIPGATPVSKGSTVPVIAATPEPMASAPGTEATAKAEPKPRLAPTPVPDERIHQFVDALHVMGIRSSGNESKVLMNDRVYRVNDIVDRALGVRLTKVSSDSLTFTDSNGAVYVKYF